MEFKKNIESHIDALLESQRKNRFSERKIRTRMPDREAVIDIIDDIRALLFPEYFDARKIDDLSVKYITGDLMLTINRKLKKQIKLAYLYESSMKDDDNADLNAMYDEADEKARRVCAAFFERLPEIYELLTTDIQAAFEGDPAAESKDIIVFSYPCMLAITVHRVAHVLYELNVPLLPRIMSEYAHSETGIDINPGAKIGRYFFIDHGTGVVIGETTVIGERVKIYQGVTLGALSTRDGQKLRFVKRHPTIEDNVTIYSGSSVLGGETVIGENAVIGSNAFITSSVPKNTRVSIKNPELSYRDRENGESLEFLQTWADGI